MINIIKGDLLEWPQGINVLCHGCNTLAVMGAGLAWSLSNKYPEVAAADKAAMEAGENLLGTFSLANLPDGKKVVNLYIQSAIGTDSRKVHYEALYTGLELLCEMINLGVERGNSYALGLPWIGCGLAGGDRGIVKAMIEKAFEKAKFDVYIVEFGQ